MKTCLTSFTAKHPVLFVLRSTTIWLAVGLLLSGAASAALGRPYGDSLTLTIGRLGAVLFCLLLLWQLGWLKQAGITRSGNGWVWLIALGSLVYSAAASLFAFYGEASFDIFLLSSSPDARSLVLVHFVAALSEEFMFRGLALVALLRAWGKTPWGVVGSLVLTSLLFAVLHLMQVTTGGLSTYMAWLLVLQSFFISFWWGVLVLFGGSLWPAVALHFAGNALVAVQGLTTPVVTPNILAYELLLWMTIPLAAFSAGLLLYLLRNRSVQPESIAD